MKHSIVSWDCSYRNFFHLIDGLLAQNYPKDQFELIYVEQRSKDYANKFNNNLGLKSLENRYEEIKDIINMKVIYLNDSLSSPYHLGKLNNAGIAIAKGEVVSVMDGDQLLTPNFFLELDKCFGSKEDIVVNLFRKMAIYPIGVKSFANWKNASINFEDCLMACPERKKKTPTIVNNYGPMISAKKKYWNLISGYDEHLLWSTGLSKLGMDVNARLEIATGNKSFYLPNAFSVHPWHPIGIGSMRTQENSKKFFSFQEELIRWSKDKKNYNLNERSRYTDKLYQENKKFIDYFINIDLNEKLKDLIPSQKIWFLKMKNKESYFYKVYNVISKIKKCLLR